MEHYAGIDVSLEFSSVCVVDAAGKIIREARVASEPSSLIAWFAALGMVVVRIGLEAGPLSQWLYAEMKTAGLAVELLETRHVRDAFKAMPVKTDRKDARGIAPHCSPHLPAERARNKRIAVGALPSRKESRWPRPLLIAHRRRDRLRRRRGS
jgi:hypothetical protein